MSVTISEGVIKQIDSDKRNVASADTSNYKMVLPGDLAYNSMRMWQGAEGVSKYVGIVSPAYTVLKPQNGFNSGFFAMMFKLETMLHVFERNSQGLTSDTWNLKYPALSKIKVNVPSLEEQNLIIEFLNNVDNLITLHQRKVDEINEYKKGLLQQMFV